MASLLLGAGLFALPALVFWVGASLLGPYGIGSGGGIGTFYGDFYADLASGSSRAWALAVGPLIVVALVRLIFLRRPAEHADPMDKGDTAPPQKRSASTADGRRIEPRVTLD